MRVEMLGYIANVGMKIGPSQDLVKEIKLEVHGDLSTLQDLMKQPLVISFEPKQATFGEPIPESRAGRRKKKASANG